MYLRSLLGMVAHLDRYGLTLDKEMKLDVCDFHDMMAQFGKVFSSGWGVNEGVSPNQANFGLALLSKSCRRCPFSDLLDQCVDAMREGLYFLFPEEQVDDEIVP